jgi:hypothetical protein
VRALVGAVIEYIVADVVNQDGTSGAVLGGAIGVGSGLVGGSAGGAMTRRWQTVYRRP